MKRTAVTFDFEALTSDATWFRLIAFHSTSSVQQVSRDPRKQSVALACKSNIQYENASWRL